MLVLLFDRFVVPLQVHVPNIHLKRVAERVRGINRGMPFHGRFLVLVVLRPSCRARLQSATLPEEMKFRSFLEWVLLYATLHLVRIALDLLVADVQVLLYVEAAVEIDRGGKGGGSVVLLETVLLLSGQLVLV